LIAKIAAKVRSKLNAFLIYESFVQVSSLYALSHRLFRDTNPAVKQILPSVGQSASRELKKLNGMLFIFRTGCHISKRSIIIFSQLLNTGKALMT